MQVKINGTDIELEEGSTIKDAIAISNAPYEEGSIICLIKGKKEFEKNINKYKLKTPKGSIIIEMIENKENTENNKYNEDYEVSENNDPRPLIDFWKNNYSEFEGLKIRWTSTNEVAIGPVTTDFEPTMDENSYNEWDVILSLSGFSQESTHIIISKEKHSAVYGVPNHNKGIFAKVVGGKRTVDLLTDEDSILAIEGVVERSSITDSSSVSDLNTVLEDGNQLFTYVSIKVNENSPESVEHLFSVIESNKNNKIKVDYDSNSFVGFYSLQGLGKDPEDETQRKRGTVTVRNTGKGIGKVYIYREDRVRAPSHTTVGYIEKGMELIDIAKLNDYITVKSNPGRIMTLSMNQTQANSYLESIGIKHEQIGSTGPNSFIVSQEPEFTIDIIKKGSIKTTAINKEDLTLIELFDKKDQAPRSAWYFKKITGLVEKPVGALKVHFAFPGMKLSIFEGNDKEAKGLIPENTANNCINAGTIGITNMSRKNVGLIGIRFEDNNEFGPTGEPFNATNIVGIVKTDLKPIEKIKEGKLLYIQEFKNIK
ncbi:MAG: methanogenesis marker 3 protein [Methanobrevibacter sp.]|jgi:putative methanogenesis marker protein 3|nr:methanogenesis marker 3 protein [Methanobrevibacter sp.]